MQKLKKITLDTEHTIHN